MSFVTALKKYELFVENGPLGTRLQYDYKFDLGPNLTVFDLITEENGRQALREIYHGDIDVAQATNLPIIINAATFRASKNHLLHRDLNGKQDVKKINHLCINFIKQARESYTQLAAPIYIAAPLGSMYDAYSTQEFPDVEQATQYHQEQINVFKETNLDFVNAVTLPSISEALGIALAAQKCDIEYTIGFVLNEHATLLDGTPLHQAIRIIDKKTIKKPIGYLVTCTHTSIIAKLLDKPFSEYQRFIGAQANGSNLPLSELNKLEHPIADPPEIFANDLLALQKKFNWKIIGGCCGTSKQHLEMLVKKYVLTD